MSINNKYLILFLGIFLIVPFSVLTVIKLGVLSIGLLLAFFFALYTAANKNAQTVLAVTLISCVLLLPRLPTSISLRVDDLFSIYVGLSLLFLIVNRKVDYSPLSKPIIYYIVYCLLITVAQMSANNLRIFYMFYFLKEIQYFIYFFFFFNYAKTTDNETLHKTFRLIFGMTFAYGFFQILAGRMTGFYGIGLISEKGSSQSGGAFFIMTMYYLYLFSSTKSKKYLFMFLAGTVLTLSTISRTAIMALIVCIVAYLILKMLTSKNTINSFVSLLIIALIGTIFIYITSKFVPHSLTANIVSRFDRIGAGSDLRTNKWSDMLGNLDFMTKLFGGGKGYAQVVTGGTKLATDSQFVRQILETGYIGLILWIVIMYKCIRFCSVRWKQNQNECTFLVLLICGFMTMSVTHEVFLVAIQASLFWIMCGSFMGKILKSDNISK